MREGELKCTVQRGTAERGGLHNRWEQPLNSGLRRSAAQRLPVQQPPLAARPRLRTLTYNLGGLDPTSYDVFCDWLQRQQDADVVFACLRSRATLGMWENRVQLEYWRMARHHLPRSGEPLQWSWNLYLGACSRAGADCL